MRLINWLLSLFSYEKETDVVIYSKWRIPTAEELVTLEISDFKEKIALQELSCKNYWSSDVCKDTGKILYLRFGSRLLYARDRTEPTNLKCVRDTSEGLEWSKDCEHKVTWDQIGEYVNKLNYLN